MLTLRSEANIGEGKTDALNHVIDRIQASVSNRTYDHIYGIGDKALLIVNDVAIQISVREDATGVYLVGISTKASHDLTVRKHGTGLGTSAILALKEYADKARKPFAVVGATTSSSSYYDKFDWLQKGFVELYFEEGIYSPNNELNSNYIYKPNIDGTKREH